MLLYIYETVKKDQVEVNTLFVNKKFKNKIIINKQPKVTTAKRYRPIYLFLF